MVVCHFQVPISKYRGWDWYKNCIKKQIKIECFVCHFQSPNIEVETGIKIVSVEICIFMSKYNEKVDFLNRVTEEY